MGNYISMKTSLVIGYTMKKMSYTKMTFNHRFKDIYIL